MSKLNSAKNNINPTFKVNKKLEMNEKNMEVGTFLTSKKFLKNKYYKI